MFLSGIQILPARLTASDEAGGHDGYRRRKVIGMNGTQKKRI